MSVWLTRRTWTVASAAILLLLAGAITGCDEDPKPDTSVADGAVDAAVETEQDAKSETTSEVTEEVLEEVGSEVLEEVGPEVDDDAQGPDGADGADGDVPDVEPVQIRGGCPLDKTGGSFNVAASDTFGFVSGAMSNGVVPVTILEEVTLAGDCRLMRRNNPFCAPPCGPGTTCDFDGQCIAFPEPQNLGDVTISGLNTGSITMSPVQPGNNYFNTSVPNPPFDAGSNIVMETAADGAYGAKMLFGRGFEVLEAVTLWNVAPSTDFVVTWTAPAVATPDAQVHLELNLDQHGNSPIILTCDFEDVGSATVPASLIDELLNSGVSGFPNGVLSRRTVDSVPMDDLCMEFLVTSTIVPDVELEGHTPCNSTADCPDGQTCNVPINTCQ